MDLSSTGYVGLGHMGSGLSGRLLLASPIRVFDLNPAARQRAVDKGAVACASVAELAAACDIILLCLPTSDHVAAVLFGPDGIAAGVKPGTLVIDQTTADPVRTRTMAAEAERRGFELMDAPVSGGPKGAADGTVAIMVGATDAQFARAEPVLRAISPNVFHAGPVGCGHVAKLANNLISAAHRVITMEALALASKNGVEADRMVDILLAGSGRNFFIERFAKSSVVNGKLATGFSLNFMHKDIRLATQLAVESGVPMFCGNAVREFFQTSMNLMGRDTEVNSVALVMDKLAGSHIVPDDYSLT